MTDDEKKRLREMEKQYESLAEKLDIQQKELIDSLLKLFFERSELIATIQERGEPGAEEVYGHINLIPNDEMFWDLNGEIGRRVRSVMLVHGLETITKYLQKREREYRVAHPTTKLPPDSVTILTTPCSFELWCAFGDVVDFRRGSRVSPDGVEILDAQEQLEEEIESKNIRVGGDGSEDSARDAQVG